MEGVPKAKAVYAELAAHLRPAMEDDGMRPVGGVSYPAWRSEVDELGQAVIVSMQVDAKATDPYAGGGFRVEVELTKQRKPARGLEGRALFFQLLTPEEIGPLLALQNSVIASRPKPPPQQVALYPQDLGVRDMYLSYFEPQSEFDAVACWLRYGSLADVREWAHILTPLVPPLVDRARAHLSQDRLALGRGSLLKPG